jgi:integral membrane sensor domain MASE1
MLTKQVIIAIAYLAAAKSSHLLAFEGSNAAPIWPATGIGLAAVLLLGYRIWPAIFIGGFLATASAFPTLGLSLTLSCAGAFFTAVGNTLESLLGAFLILRFTAWPNQFERHSDTFRFILGGAIVPAVVSATIGTTAQAVVIGNWKSYGAIWLTWWLGDAAGTLVVAPLILTCKQRMREWQWKKAVEGAVLLALLLALGWLVFQRDYHVQYTLLLGCLPFQPLRSVRHDRAAFDLGDHGYHAGHRTVCDPVP